MPERPEMETDYWLPFRLASLREKRDFITTWWNDGGPISSNEIRDIRDDVERVRKKVWRRAGGYKIEAVRRKQGTRK